MSEEKKSQDKDCIKPVDSQGRPQLCCCYIIEQDGGYADPCYTPVDDCCCCG